MASNSNQLMKPILISSKLHKLIKALARKERRTLQGMADRIVEHYLASRTEPTETKEAR